jgi:hypothetical protein
MPLRARIYIALVIVLGLAAAVNAAAGWTSVSNPLRLAAYALLTAAASLAKLRLPGLDGTYSLNGVFLLAGAVYFTLPETVAAALAGVLVQSYVGAERRPGALKTLFNISNEVFSISAAQISISYLVREGHLPFRPALLAAAAAMYFLLNTGMVSGILTLLGGGEFRHVNRQWYFWSFPYYLLGAAVVGATPLDGRAIDFEACALLVPLAYLSHFFCGIAQSRGGAVWQRADAPASIPAGARAFTAAVAAAAASFVAFAVSRAARAEWGMFLALLALAVMTATWKVRLPGMAGTISVHYVIMLVAVAELSLLEALAISAAGPLVQTLWRPQARPQAVQVLFNTATMILATSAAFCCCRIGGHSALLSSLPAFLAAAATLHFLTNTLLVAAVISLVESAQFVALWRRMYFWTFPIYMVGASAAALMVAATRAAGWAPALLILPLMAMIQYSYRLHLAGQFTLGQPSEPVREAA